MVPVSKGLFCLVHMEVHVWSQTNFGKFLVVINRKFVVPVFQGGAWCAIDGNTTSSHVYLFGCRRKFFFFSVINANFVDPVFRGGDLCDINGNIT